MRRVAVLSIALWCLAASGPAAAQTNEDFSRTTTGAVVAPASAAETIPSQPRAHIRPLRRSAQRVPETGRLEGGSAEPAKRVIDVSSGEPTDLMLARLFRQASDQPVPTAAELLETIGRKPKASQVALLWEGVADTENAALVTLPVVSALAAASQSTEARDALWSGLAALARRAAKVGPKERERGLDPQTDDQFHRERETSLLGLFERHGKELLALLPPMRESESAGDEIVNLMLSSHVFGGTIETSIATVVGRDAGAVARRIGRERDLGKRVKWEWDAFEALVAWKNQNVPFTAAARPRSMDEFDARGETFIAIMNNLHAFDPWFRAKLLQGLQPAEVFNAVVGGEVELYRMGTSTYREHLHAVIMRGIKAAGSFESFIAAAAPRHVAEVSAADATRRGMVYVRVASTFALLEAVLDTVKDRERFVTDAIRALGDPVHFELDSSLVIDLVTGAPSSEAAVAFKRLLVDRLYAAHMAARDPVKRAVYGSILSVYQQLTGDRRETSIDTAFSLDDVAVELPFERLFVRSGGRLVHRMFMRFDKDTDAFGTYTSFRATMRGRRAAISSFEHYEVFRIYGNGRTIEVYANRPGEAGIRRGIPAIAAALSGKRVDTVIGRGHSSIVKPLEEDARRVLGNRIHHVSAVILGTCGGDAAVRKLISTFGYVPYLATKATGRQLINNAIVDAYIAALLKLKANQRLSLGDVLVGVAADFGDIETKEDAGFYRVALSTVMAAHLFDTHVRGFVQLPRQAAR